MNGEIRSNDASRMRIFYFFGAFFALIFLINLLLVWAFQLPKALHWLLFPLALAGFYTHFCLICCHDSDQNMFHLIGRGKLLFPIILVCQLALKLTPGIKKQAWHKHRGLLIAGPIYFFLALLITALAFQTPLSWPLITVFLISITAGYYSVSVAGQLGTKFF